MARKLVSRALLKNIIKREACFVCGDSAEAHHPDYQRPLDVVWLCKAHHIEVHAMAKEIEKFT